MKINKITVWALDLPLSEPYWLSGGRLKFERLDSTFVRVETDAGICGWGEGCPWGHTYLPAHGGGVRAALEIIAPALLGRDPRALDDINRAMDFVLPGHLYAKSAADIACWDILGRAAELPLWKLLGGETARPVAVNSSISTGSAEEMLARIEKARAAGYKTHSAKIGGNAPGADIARINAVEAARLPDELITFDINRAWTPALAVQILNSVAARGWIEQPCETLDQCAHVAARVAQPLMLDECLHGFGGHLRAWQNRAGEGIKLKPNRVGGLTKARRIRDFGAAVGWQMHIEDTGGSALADTAAIHLAASTPDENRLASWLCHAHLAADPVSGQGARNNGGFAVPPESPGLGVVPDEEKLGKPAAVYAL
ncbi:MAG: mandelate racemase/muconate lactonizing enzyme family protein [Gammaproteobacteria bacterium]